MRIFHAVWLVWMKQFYIKQNSRNVLKTWIFNVPRDTYVNMSEVFLSDNKSYTCMYSLFKKESIT